MLVFLVKLLYKYIPFQANRPDNQRSSFITVFLRLPRDFTRKFLICLEFFRSVFNRFFSKVVIQIHPFSREPSELSAERRIEMARGWEAFFITTSEANCPDKSVTFSERRIEMVRDWGTLF